MHFKTFVKVNEGITVDIIANIHLTCHFSNRAIFFIVLPFFFSDIFFRYLSLKKKKEKIPRKMNTKMANVAPYLQNYGYIFLIF